MKNEMKGAWESVCPDNAAEERMLSEILAYHGEHAARKNFPIKKTVAAAACMIMITAAVIFGIRSGMLAKDYTYTLPDGQTVVYTKGSIAGEAKYDILINGKQRELTESEMRTLFPTLEGYFNGFAFFDESGDMCHIEFHVSDGERYFTNDSGERVRVIGGAGQLKICASKEGLPVTDCIVSGNESGTEVDGVQLKTGYFVTKQNSRGVRTAVFFAEYTINGTTVYAELAGDNDESERVCEKLTAAVYGMIKANSPDISAVRY